MKVYYIGSGYDGCYYVRCLLPMRANGWNGHITSLRKGVVDLKTMMQGAMESDVIVFQRPLDKKRYESAKLLKQAGKKIVMDNDDTYSKESGVPLAMFDENSKNQVEKFIKTIDSNLKDFALISDAVTTTTDFLKTEYSHSNEKVFVLPNCVDPDDWELKPKRNDGRKVRIGLVGSTAYSKDYSHISDLLFELGEREDVQIVMFSLPADKKAFKMQRDELYKEEIEFWNKVGVEWQHFVPMSEYNDTLNELALDLMLIPRQDNYFNRCKSNIKFLEASMLEIPVIAQSFLDRKSPYEVNEEDAKYLVLAQTPDDWFKAVNSFIEDRQLRREVGKKAKSYVIDNYSIYNNSHRWQEVYESI